MKILYIAALSLVVSSFVGAQPKVISTNDIYRLALSKLDPKTPNYDEIMAHLFVGMNFPLDERPSELDSLLRRFGGPSSTKGKYISELIQSIEDYPRTSQCILKAKAFEAFKQVVDQRNVPAIKTAWNSYRTTLQSAHISLDATDSEIDSKVNALRETGPTPVTDFSQAYKAMIDAKNAFEADTANTNNLKTFKNAIDAVVASLKAKPRSLSQEEDGMILVSKCVFNVFAKGEKPYEIDKKNADEVLTIAINLTDKANVQVRNAIAAAYFALSTEQEKQKVADAFKAHFGQDIKAIGLAVLVGKFPDNAQLQSSYKQLKECDASYAQAETLVKSGK